ncbi:hypothetical protein GGH99_000660 [Coemansia sp. RSA 1285]|nr:hypothetical protein GGH99_000660 [Coemansia sp. RSA 1285]
MMLSSGDNNADSSSSAKGLGSIAAQSNSQGEAISNSNLMMIFQAFFDRQDQRDAKREKETKEWREEQARREAKRDQRDAKREKETKEWREEQARREAKRDQRDAKREKETKEWRGEQARRDKAIINALTQLTRNPEHQTSRGKQPVSNTADPHTPLPRYNNVSTVPACLGATWYECSR